MSADESKSVVLITVDCLRADHTGFMGYSRPTTPFLDELARESFVFPNAIVTGAPTYYSFPGLMASRWPLSLGREVVGIAPGERTLATVLQEAGYITAGFVAANPYLSPRFGYEQGFDVFRDFLSQPRSEGTDKESRNHGEHRDHRRLTTRVNQQVAEIAHRLPVLGKFYDEAYFQYCQRKTSAKHEDWESLRCFPAADVLIEQACDWLEAIGRQPFFLWLHFMDPHAPYYPPVEVSQAMGEGSFSAARGRYVNESWKRGDIGSERRRKYQDDILSLYDAGIRWVDMQLTRLADFLRTSSRWNSCVLVLTADHGEEFLDHGSIFHSPSRPYQEMLHVPLLIRVPGLHKKLSPAPFSHLHLAPTVLDAIGIDSPPEFEGRSYWREMQAGGGWDFALSESVGRCKNPMDPKKRMGGRVLTVQDEKYKLVLDFECGSEALYDLQTDPHERNCLPEGAENRVRAEMLRVAREHLGRTRSNTGSALRAIVRELGLEWSHFKKPTETLVT